MRWLSDKVLAHLGRVADWPDLDGTPYELLDKLGEGGMGVVFLARDRRLDRPVALKVLHTLADAAEAKARMLREAHVLARLEHPNIVPVHDAGVLSDGRFYYTMKYVRGRRLDEQAGPPAALAERLQLFRKICDAVAFAHAQGVLHRDLKPQNIMLGAFGEVLVLDWGVAKLLGDTQPPPGTATPTSDEPPPAQTRHGTVLGTPGYMAPEQARGEVDRLDQRADVYALGGILYFLLTGQAPPSVTTLSDPPRPRRHDRAIPRPLEAICLQALAGEPADRYPGAADLGTDVANFLAGRRVQAYPEGVLGAALRLGNRHRAALGLVLAYVVMRVLLLIFLGH